MKAVSEFQLHMPPAGISGEFQVGRGLNPDARASRGSLKKLWRTASLVALGLRESVFHARCCRHIQAPKSILLQSRGFPQENKTLELRKAASKFSPFFYIILNVSKSLIPKYVNKHSTSFCLSGKINANFPPGGRREEVCVS